MDMDNFRAIIKIAVKTARSITDDQEALKVKGLYKQFEKQIGRSVEVGEYIQYNDKLYRVLQAHTVQLDWTPDISASLFIVIDLEHKGTLDDPIPAQMNMEYFKGKYYVQDEIIYVCTRDSEIALQFLPKDLIGSYFELYNEEVVDEPEVDVEDMPEESPEDNIEDEVVAEEGTLENPIVAQVGIVYYNGKYYIENDVIYLCTRDSENALYHMPSALVGVYFQKVN